MHARPKRRRIEGSADPAELFGGGSHSRQVTRSDRDPELRWEHAGTSPTVASFRERRTDCSVRRVLRAKALRQRQVAVGETLRLTLQTCTIPERPARLRGRRSRRAVRSPSSRIVPPMVRDVGIIGVRWVPQVRPTCGLFRKRRTFSSMFRRLLAPMWPSLTGVEQAMRGDFHGWH
jgi:hypothetical protein